MTFNDLFPGAADFVANLGKTPPFSVIGDLYAPFGAIHLIGLALLGGCVIIMNLRLLGAGITDEAPSTIERNLRLWHYVGAAIVIGTGLVIGGLNAERLYTSGAFFVKMISMLSALIFTFGVVNAIAKNEGKVSTASLVLGAIAMVIFMIAMGVFSITDGISPGTFHVLTAGYAVLLLFGKKTRVLAGVAFVVMFGTVIEGYMVAGLDSFSPELQNLGVVRSWTAGVLLITLIGYEIYRQDATAGGRVARLIAVLSILSWVATAAGGRWIGFS
ncbi:MAG: hypothetical protein K9G83_11075 [Hyphomonadaceae bacterium]|nr:hypothetical protein [Hyphomonadaceae bacterium]